MPCSSPDAASTRQLAFSADLQGADPVACDRNANLGPLLACIRPDLVIDAAGPFQGSHYRVPLACIPATIPYLDLADARGFVTGIDALDRAAKGWSLLRLPLPLALAPREVAREWQEEGRFRFDVPIALPLVGLVLHHTGWLETDRPTSS